jgi:hypothetical protein
VLRDIQIRPCRRSTSATIAALAWISHEAVRVCEAKLAPALAESLRTGKAFFRSARAITRITPDRATTDGHDSYPRAIRTELGPLVRHRTKGKHVKARIYLDDSSKY